MSSTRMNVTWLRSIIRVIESIAIRWVGILFYSFPLACAECDDSLPYSGASSIPLYYVLYPAPLLHQLFFHPLSPHLVICFLVYLSVLLFPNSYIIAFWEFYFLSFTVHAQISVICLTLSDPTSDLVRQYDFRVLLRCRKTSDTVFVAFARCREPVRRFSSCSTDFSQQIAQVVLFLFLHVFLF
jgi:hypothetical protein